MKTIKHRRLEVSLGTAAAILVPVHARWAGHLKALSSPLITLHEHTWIDMCKVEVTGAGIVWSITRVVVFCAGVTPSWPF